MQVGKEYFEAKSDGQIVRYTPKTLIGSQTKDIDDTLQRKCELGITQKGAHIIRRVEYKTVTVRAPTPPVVEGATETAEESETDSETQHTRTVTVFPFGTRAEARAALSPDRPEDVAVLERLEHFESREKEKAEAEAATPEV
jgi:hypothetical protein